MLQLPPDQAMIGWAVHFVYYTQVIIFLHWSFSFECPEAFIVSDAV